MTRQQLITDVNHLLEVCNERILGYRKAAENVKDADLKSLFKQYAVQTESFEKDLMRYSDNPDPKSEGTRAISDAWRLWMDMKAAMTNGGAEAMLGASITGEEAAIKEYEEALEDDLPLDLKSIVQKQLEQIRNACQNLKEIKKGDPKNPLVLNVILEGFRMTLNGFQI